MLRPFLTALCRTFGVAVVRRHGGRIQCVNGDDLNVSVCYETEVGMKFHNQTISSDLFTHFITGPVRLVPARELYSGFDALRDAHTLIDTDIASLPHVDFVARIRKGEDLESSAYVARLVRGTLDFRPAGPVRRGLLDELRADLRAQLERVEAGEFEPVRTVEVGGRLYLMDGRHRAAMCALLGREIPTVDVNRVYYDSFFWWVHAKMKQRPELYRRHLAYFAAARGSAVAPPGRGPHA